MKLYILNVIRLPILAVFFFEKKQKKKAVYMIARTLYSYTNHFTIAYYFLDITSSH